MFRNGSRPTFHTSTTFHVPAVFSWAVLALITWSEEILIGTFWCPLCVKEPWSYSTINSFVKGLYAHTHTEICLHTHIECPLKFKRATGNYHWPRVWTPPRETWEGMLQWIILTNYFLPYTYGNCMCGFSVVYMYVCIRVQNVNLCVRYACVFCLPGPTGKLLQLSVSGRKASSKAFSELRTLIFP